MDDLIAGSGVAYRALANPSFFENLLEEVDSIREKGLWADTLDARRKVPLVTVAGIAAVATDLLLDRSWTGTTDVPAPGPQDLSPDGLARIMTEQLDRSVRYARQPLDELHTALVGFGLNEELVRGVVEMKRAKDEVLDSGVARTARTARTASPTTFEQWCTQILRPALLS
ncbi:hypothetical protein [Kitasatospora terrestris]|uniref:Uncharacterized protein n=1 Tax=Kitasatospora terrestris TaxID=258051 RepID=A0ABP9D9W2_9ACTN